MWWSSEAANTIPVQGVGKEEARHDRSGLLCSWTRFIYVVPYEICSLDCRPLDRSRAGRRPGLRSDDVKCESGALRSSPTPARVKANASA